MPYKFQVPQLAIKKGVTSAQSRPQVYFWGLAGLAHTRACPSPTQSRGLKLTLHFNYKDTICISPIFTPLSAFSLLSYQYFQRVYFISGASIEFQLSASALLNEYLWLISLDWLIWSSINLRDFQSLHYRAISGSSCLILRSLRDHAFSHQKGFPQSFQISRDGRLPPTQITFRA